MTSQATEPRRRGASVAWSAGDARDALQLIAEGVTEVAGFGVAAISVARDDGYMQVMAVAGSEEARRTLEGRRTPIDDLMAEVAKADDWGLLKFVPHERLDVEAGSWGWVPDIEPLDGPDAWHPLDLLVAPLCDEQGVLRGSLSMDVPKDGRRPGAEQRRMLEVYAAQAGRAVVTALEREALAEQVRLAEAARAIVRRASAKLRLDEIFAASQEALCEGFRAVGLWIQTFEHEGAGSGALYSAIGTDVELDADLQAIAEKSALRAWTDQETYVVTPGEDAGPVLDVSEQERVTALLERIGVGSLLFTPLGAGPECLGNLVLTRRQGAPAWTEVERTTALDIGHDLGRAILNARTFEREHRAVKELRALDAYKSQLIATVSHELKNPLAAIVGHLEMLESDDLSPQAQTSVAAIGRGTRRLSRVVDDLLLLSRMGDPDNQVVRKRVDLRHVVEDALDLVGVQAERKSIRLVLRPESEDLAVLGDAGEIDRVCSNLLSNAVKYTPDGRTVTVVLRRVDGQVVLTVADEGIGISAEDQRQLFTEFFRSTNPEAIAQPGTGLGLAIVARIVARHDGRIEVDSELGRGSTFRVWLPAAD